MTTDLWPDTVQRMFELYTHNIRQCPEFLLGRAFPLDQILQGREYNPALSKSP